MTRAEFENKTFEEVMEQLNEEKDDITTYEMLKEFAVSKIEEDNLLIAIHILEAINNDSAEWYIYMIIVWGRFKRHLLLLVKKILNMNFHLMINQVLK